MIQFRHHVLQVQKADLSFELMDESALIDFFQTAFQAELSQRPDWIIPAMCESILQYFQKNPPSTSLTSERLLQVGRTLFHGYIQACESHPSSIWRRLDLFETVCQEGPPCELLFFERLHIMFQELPKILSVTSRIQIIGVKRCAKFLGGRRRWSSHCTPIRDEIIGRLRDEASHAGIENLSVVVVN